MTGGGVAIRPGRDSDAPGYIALIAACWGEYSDHTDVLAEAPEVSAFATYVAGRCGGLWTAEQDGRVVGMIATYPADDGWHLSRMYAAPAQRGTGLAQSLLHGAQSHARRAGGQRLVLWSDVRFTRAHAFYEKHGFVRRGGLRPLRDYPDVIEAGYAKPLAGRAVEELDVAAAESAERPLAAILQACAHDGGSTGFLPPLARDTALSFWRSVTRAVGQRRARLFVAWLDGEVVGTVHLRLDMPEDQSHRAELHQLLVSPGVGHGGVASALTQAAQTAARTAGLRLLVADTPSGGASLALLRSLGWTEAGSIPGYVVDVHGQGWTVSRVFTTLS